MITARSGDVIVECDDEKAMQTIANIIANHFSSNWLEGAEETDTLFMDVNQNGHLVKYSIKSVRIH